MAYRTQDTWSSDRDYLIDLGHQIKSRIRERSASQNVTPMLKEYEEALDLMRKQANLRSLTDREKIQRQKDVDKLSDTFEQLNHSATTLNTSQSFNNHQQLDDDRLNSGPGLGQRMSVDEIRTQQRQLIAEQDKGLDAISAALRRQQKVGLAIQDEVAEHNVIIDDISAGTSRADARIKRETQRIEERRKKEKSWCTCVLWIMILVLALAILIVSVVPK